MKQQQFPTLGSSPEAYALTLDRQQLEDITEGLRQSIFEIPEDEHYPAARRRFLQFERFCKMLGKPVVIALLFFAFIFQAGAQSLPTVYVDGPEDFSTALTAALNKKHVPVQVTLDQHNADYVLHVGGVASKTESGGSQVARCLFMDCIGAFGSSSASVTLVKSNSSDVLWAYQVRKGMGGPMGMQSMSEAIAKHLKKDYFKEK